MTNTDLAALIPQVSKCLYCECGMHDHCVENQRDDLGRIKVICECFMGGHGGRS